MASEAILQSRKSSCPGQPMPALAYRFLTWWGRDEISKGSSSPASLLIDFQCRQGHSTLPVTSLDSMLGLEVSCSAITPLIFTISPGSCFTVRGSFSFPLPACLRNDFSCSSQQILSQPHLAEIRELCCTFASNCHFNCASSKLCQQHRWRSAHLKVSMR